MHGGMLDLYQCQLSLPSIQGQIMSSSLWAMGWKPSAADGGCVSCCNIGPIVDYRGQPMAAQSIRVSLTHATQLPLPK